MCLGAVVVFYKDGLSIYPAVTVQKPVVPPSCLQARATLESLLAELMPDLALRKCTQTHKRREKRKEKGRVRGLKSKP